MIKDLLNKRKYITVSTVNLSQEDNIEKPNIPTGMWSKCNSCGKIVYTEDLKTSMKVCPNCNYHFRVGAYERIKFTVDKDSFKEFDINLIGNNPLDFPNYKEKVESAQKKAEVNEAVIAGEALIYNRKVVICVMDSNFMMGSMGTAVGEKITRAIEYATDRQLPVVIFTCSGGARMQEGILSLMQMAKISGAISRHSNKGLLYITVLTDPTTGGVTASFAMEGDIILSEPKCVIGFAGRRVIEKTLNTKLPEDFQTAEFLLEKGFIDKIVHRKHMRNTIGSILKIHEVK